MEQPEPLVHDGASETRIYNAEAARVYGEEEGVRGVKPDEACVRQRGQLEKKKTVETAE